MAGTPLGASSAPTFLPFPNVFSTRTRALHGAFLIDTQMARVWSSKRADDPRGVIVQIGDDAPVTLTGRFSVTQARMIARALSDAAAALELATGQKGGAQ